MERGQDAVLLPMVMSVLQQANKTFADCDRIAVTRGPGSFTGVRVGLAAARGIGIAAGKPVIGIDRFVIYRKLFQQVEKNLFVVIDSKRAELFCQFFPARADAHEPNMLTQTEIDAFLAVHPDTKIAGDNVTADADILLACGGLAADADPHELKYATSPLYLRAPDVTMPKIPT